MAEADDVIKQGRLLILDDEVSSLCLLENVLQRLGFRNIRTLNDPRRAVAEIENFRPDLLITDIEMPVMGGLQVIRTVRSGAKESADLPILVLTGNVRPLARQDAFRAGATEILFKPLDSCEMLMRVSSLLRGHFLQQQIQSHNRLLEDRVAERTAELQHALAELKAAQHQVVQQERLRAFSEMAGGVVHDFNNALMSVIGYSELLLADDELLGDREVVREYLGTINTAGVDASHVVSRLRDFYRPREADDVFTPTDLNDLIEEAVPLTRPKWHDRALESGRVVKLELELQKLPPVLANASELREVITNMIFNAVDAMPEGGTITIRTVGGGARVRMEIADTGIGMSEEVRLRCAEPFFTTKGEHGTGLGLSMSFGILRRHEGTLEIDSIEGIGTTFRIELPSCEAGLGAAAGPAAQQRRGLRILVVDDDPVSLEVVTRFLRADLHEVSSASSGEHALVQLNSRPFDVLVTDQGMPQMSGLQLAEQAAKIRPAIRTLLVTGFGPSAEQEIEAIHRVLRKPVSRETLRGAVEEVLG
jgi:signal transduction histidine kinase